MATSIERLRAVCLGLPETTEKLSHGEPAWFAKGRLYAICADHHHDDRLAFWCAAPPGAQEAMVQSDPSRFFRPPYVGHRGWLGVYLDVRVNWMRSPESWGKLTGRFPIVAAAERRPRSSVY